MHDPDDHDIVWGAAAIAKVINVPERRVYYLLQNGLIPAFKRGNRWGARRSELHADLTGVKQRAAKPD